MWLFLMLRPQVPACFGFTIVMNMSCVKLSPIVGKHMLKSFFSPLLHEFFSLSVFEILLKIGCYCLPTHRRGVHRKFFIIPSYFKIEIVDKCCSFIKKLYIYIYMVLEMFSVLRNRLIIVLT